MSAGHNDEERMPDWYPRKDEQDRAIERFQDRDDRFSVLVVCDMVLTGFDAPVEQVLYLNALLRAQRAAQRANTAAGHRPREPPAGRGEDLQANRRLLGRVGVRHHP